MPHDISALQAADGDTARSYRADAAWLMMMTAKSIRARLPARHTRNMGDDLHTQSFASPLAARRFRLFRRCHGSVREPGFIPRTPMLAAYADDARAERGGCHAIERRRRRLMPLLTQYGRRAY